MSDESWIKEYYSVPADQVEEDEALQHSLQKWIGLRQENLAKHGIKYPPIPTDSDTCALCYHYNTDDCFECPLAESRNGTPCDLETDDEDVSPYRVYRKEYGPGEMIIALQKAIVYLENKKGGK